MIQYRFLTSNDVTLYKKTVMTFRQQEVSDEKASEKLSEAQKKQLQLHL